jgi:hypothetical protein
MKNENALAGLSSTEAASRLKQDGPTLLPGSQPKTLFSIVLSTA